MSRFRNLFAVLAIAVVQAMAAASDSRPKTPQPEGIPYASLEEALKALRAKPGVTFKEEGGWTVAYDPEAIVSWLLTLPGHPAYPSIVKRYIVNEADGAYMAADTRCFASKVVCDRFFGGQ